MGSLLATNILLILILIVLLLALIGIFFVVMYSANLIGISEKLNKANEELEYIKRITDNIKDNVDSLEQRN
jgi:flagellar basal body-associated protein FliL